MGENLKMQKEIEELKQKLNSMQREKDIANLAARYTQLGYGDLAESTAIAYLDGDTDTVFKNQRSIIDRARQDKKPAIKTDNTVNPIRRQKGEYGIDDLFCKGFFKPV